MEDLKQTETPAQLIMRALFTHHNRTYNETLDFRKAYGIDDSNVENEQTEISITIGIKGTEIEIFGSQPSCNLNRIANRKYDHPLSYEEIKEIIKSILKEKSNISTSDYYFHPNKTKEDSFKMCFTAGIPQASKNGAKFGYGPTELEIIFKCDLELQKQIIGNLYKDFGEQIGLNKKDIDTLLKTKEKIVRLSALEYIAILNQIKDANSKNGNDVTKWPALLCVGEFGNKFFPKLTFDEKFKKSTVDPKIKNGFLVFSTSLISHSGDIYEISRKIPLDADISMFFDGVSAREIINRTIEGLKSPNPQWNYCVSPDECDAIVESFNRVLYGEPKKVEEESGPSLTKKIPKL